MADLPAGRDPADVWRDDPERLLAGRRASAKPFLQFRIDRALAAADRDTLEGRARAAEAAAAIVAEHPSELVRDQYVMKLAGGLDIDADRLRDTVATRAAARRRRRRRARRDPAARAAGDATRVAARRSPRARPAAVWASTTASSSTDWLDARLFADPVARGRVRSDRRRPPTCHDAIASSEGPVRELLERSSVEEPVEDDEPETLRARLLANAVEPAAERVLARMLRAGDERASAVKVLLDALAHARDVGRLGSGRARRNAVARVDRGRVTRPRHRVNVHS